ncbi:MAG: winged helix-turn-helix domain-containing protein [Bifidobacteriaceae bacterium]|nr:winged helix-turn-helix domain-containing protein [Bifidobacteriaceae bacterium]
MKELKAKNYCTRQSIADLIYEKFGIKVSLLTVSRLLKKHNFKLLKSCSLPAKADPKKQRPFFRKFYLR